MAELAKEVRLAASYGELNDSLHQRVELVMRFFLALGKEIDAQTAETSQQAHTFGGAGDNRNACRIQHRKHLRNGAQLMLRIGSFHYQNSLGWSNKEL